MCNPLFQHDYWPSIVNHVIILCFFKKQNESIYINIFLNKKKQVILALPYERSAIFKHASVFLFTLAKPPVHPSASLTILQPDP